MTIQIRYNMRQRDITDIQGEQEPLFEYERNLFPFFFNNNLCKQKFC